MKDLDRASGIGGVGGASRSLKTDDDLSSTLVEIVDLTPAEYLPIIPAPAYSARLLQPRPNRVKSECDDLVQTSAKKKRALHDTSRQQHQLINSHVD